MGSALHGTFLIIWFLDMKEKTKECLQELIILSLNKCIRIIKDIFYNGYLRFMSRLVLTEVSTCYKDQS